MQYHTWEQIFLESYSLVVKIYGFVWHITEANHVGTTVETSLKQLLIDIFISFIKAIYMLKKFYKTCKKIKKLN